VYVERVKDKIENTFNWTFLEHASGIQHTITTPIQAADTIRKIYSQSSDYCIEKNKDFLSS